MKKLQPTPIALALFFLFPGSGIAAVNLPKLQIDPALLGQKPAPAAGASQASPPPPRPAARPAGEAENPPAAAPQRPSLPLAAPTAVIPARPLAAGAAASAPADAQPQAGGPGQPLYISADRLQGHRDAEMEAFGNVELKKGDQAIHAEYLTYFQPEDEVYAKDKVVIEQKGDVMAGPELRLKMDQREGYMASPVYRLQEGQARGDADKLLFQGQDKYVFQQTHYTTCPVGNNDWYLNVDRLDIDRAANIGTAHNASVTFKGVPILYAPWLDFALSKQRKTGLLTPTFGSTANSGSELMLPFYWNIAPNRDATITPRLLTKRGLQLGGEFRYLEPDYRGLANVEALPNDQLTGSNRYALLFQHQQNLGAGWSGNLNLQKVSDNNYFTDLSTQIATTSISQLPREGSLNYAGNGWNFMLRAQKFQTLQDINNTQTIPYYRLPQLLLTGSQLDVYGADIAYSGEFVDFRHPTSVNGKRLMFYPTISYPIRPAFGYLTPKLGLNMTRYTLDQSTTNLPDATRVVPTFSLDSGLVFERDWQGFGNTFQQTLEPRVYYVYVPYRDQSQLPVFDSAYSSVGFPQIFSENRFVGNDRIGDANQVTFGLTTRFLESNGNERLRATIAQRNYLTLPRVTLPGVAAPTSKASDILLGLNGHISQPWRLDGYWQYNPDLQRSEAYNFGTNYRPEPGKVLNLSYRYAPDPTGLATGNLRQFDVSSQWPLQGGWYGVGRYNYSLQDRKLLEGLAGLEYNGGCWVSRFVVHSLATSTDKMTTAFFIQLELNGLSKVGTDPLIELRRNIAGYTKINEQP
ncbi:MAG: LPS-assembly protein LptD [Burkholderiales bacterium]